MTCSSWLPLEVDSPVHEEGRKLLKQKKPGVCHQLRDLHWLMWDTSSSRASMQEEVGSPGIPPERWKAGRAAEVHPDHGTLVAENLNISEVSWEKRPFMEGSFLICIGMVL